MTKVLVFTITQNRKELFEKYYKTFQEKNKDIPGIEICHLIVDNGSDKEMKDVLWNLQRELTIIFNPENIGITEAWVQALQWATTRFQFDYFVKFDPDVKVESAGILKHFIKLSQMYGDKFIAAPVDLNIKADFVPHRMGIRRLFPVLEKENKQLPFVLTSHIGSACSFYSARAMQLFLAEPIKPKGDAERGGFFRSKGFEVGYFETLSMSHMGVDQPGFEYKY